MKKTTPQHKKLNQVVVDIILNLKETADKKTGQYTLSNTSTAVWTHLGPVVPEIWNQVKQEIDNECG